MQFRTRDPLLSVKPWGQNRGGVGQVQTYDRKFEREKPKWRKVLKSYLETGVGCGAPDQLDAAVHWTLWPAEIICSEFYPTKDNKRMLAPATLRPSEHLHLTETKVLSIRAIVPEN